MLSILTNIFDSRQFIPHGHCYLWKPGLVWLHIASDLLIALAYYSIPLMLLYFVHKRSDVPFRGIFLMFGTFIVSCGTTHVVEVWTLWHPIYWLSGSLKAATAIVSLYTASKLFTLIPQALALHSPAELEEANQKLAEEIIERQQTEAALRDSEARFRSMFEGAAIGIELVDMEGRTVAMNRALGRMLGYSDNELGGMSFKEDTDREDVSTAAEFTQELINSKPDCQEIKKRYLGKDRQIFHVRDYYQMEKRYLRKDGQLLWCRVTASLVRDADGKPEFGIRMVEDITERKLALKELRQYQEHLDQMVGERTAKLTQANEQLLWEASHDRLTQLINRGEFEKRLQEAVSSAKLQNHQHTLCYLDLDRFKIVNDTCGHAAGDELLRQISDLWQSFVRNSDVLARLGGDEFALLLYYCSIEKGLKLASALHESIQNFRFVWEDKTFTIGVSIGIVAIDANSGSLESVLNAADAACYVAKNKGRNCVHIYTTEDTELAQQRSELQWAARIKNAIADNQFRLYYQAIVPITSSEATKQHYEILLRMLDETGEEIPPMAFLPAAERYNLMPNIDRWVIHTLFAMLSQHSREIHSHCLYTINLSSASAKDRDFSEFIKEQFATFKIPPQMICFEIPESVAINNLTTVDRLIRNLKPLGCRFALDNFGSSMSAFTYLKHLPVDFLKVAGELVKEIANDEITYAMVEAINQIGHVMGIQTVAKSVENNIILGKVKDIGLDYAQGYGIATPKLLSICSNFRGEKQLRQKLNF